VSANSNPGRLTHGSSDHLEQTTPVLGKTAEHNGITFDLFTSHHIEVHFTAERDAIVIPLNWSQMTAAQNSDKKKQVDFKPGQLSVHMTGCTHYSRTDSNPIDAVETSFPRKFRRRVLADLGQSETSLRDGISGPFSAEGAREIGSTLQRMHIQGAIDSALIAESLAISLIRNAILAIDGSETSARVNGQTAIGAALVNRLRDYILSDLTQDLSLQDLASLAGVSPFHFARCFKLSTGQSPHQFVLDLRLTRAREELAGGKNTLADIAYAVGFSSQAHMTDVFKKRLGVTPGRYRKELAA